MYPRNYFDLFPPFPRNSKVFVVMSFASEFEPRWKTVIGLVIRGVHINDKPLEPHRVDARQISDSILTEILGGITNDLLVFANIMTVGKLNAHPVRNGNVMYEVGLAHAVRCPEEIVLFRSDKDPMLFDVANVRVNYYDPDGVPDEARNKLGETIVATINEIDLRRHLAVQRAARSLDYRMWVMLAKAVSAGNIYHFETATTGQALGNAANNAAIKHLLELGALEADFTKLTEDTIRRDFHGPGEKLVEYKPTMFGKTILNYIADKMGVHDVMKTLVDVATKHDEPPNSQGI